MANPTDSYIHYIEKCPLQLRAQIPKEEAAYVFSTRKSKKKKQ